MNSHWRASQRIEENASPSAVNWKIPFVGLIKTVFLNPGQSGRLARRLLAAAILVPIALEFIRVEGIRQHWFSSPAGDAITLILTIVIMALMVGLGCSSAISAETKLRMAQQAAEAARDEAQRANVAKSSFLSRMSHELRTPLNAILGFSQLLEMANLEERHAENVKHIFRGGKHLLNLINEVLDISRIESGNLSLSMEDVEVNCLLGEAVSLMGPTCQEKGITMRIAQQGPETYVTADKQRLLQVCLNLLSNAVKYNHRGGTVDIGFRDAGKVVEIEVRDTGLGIPPEKISNLFVPFDRLGVEAHGIEGTGLGLALSKCLTETMGGALAFRPNEGQGSIFTVTVIRSEAQAGLVDLPCELQPTSSETGLEPKILLIEDNQTNVDLLGRALRGRPIKILTAMQGRLGLEMVKQHRPVLILLDLNLPDMHGSELLLLLKSTPSTVSIPVIVTSADATPGQIRRIVEAGAFAYLTKPLDVNQLLENIDAALADLRLSA